MRVAYVAEDFYARHPEGAVFLVCDDVRCSRFGEAWPAGSAVELGVGVEEVRFAAAAFVAAGREDSAHFGAVGALRAVFAHDVELLGT
jgi:hypothetical protein